MADEATLIPGDGTDEPSAVGTSKCADAVIEEMN
jgi:hypothetical protein